MFKYLGLLLGALALPAPAFAIEPAIAQQVVPASPHLLFLGRDRASRFIFIETATSGVMAETGFGWIAVADPRTGVPTYFERTIVDCTNRVLMSDWITYVDESGRALEHHQGTDVHLANGQTDDRIWDAICNGYYTGRGEQFDGVPAAVAWASSIAGQDFDLGERIKLREVGDLHTFDVTWVRYGRSNFYKAVYMNVANGLKGDDVVEVKGVKDGVLQVDRLGAVGVAIQYYFPIVNGDIGRGSAVWSKKPGSYIEVLSRQ